MGYRSHWEEIAAARRAEFERYIAPDMAQIEAIEQAGEARAAKVAQQPRDELIRLAHDDPRPPVAAILVWAAGTCMWVCAALAAYAVWG